MIFHYNVHVRILHSLSLLHVSFMKYILQFLPNKNMTILYKIMFIIIKNEDVENHIFF